MKRSPKTLVAVVFSLALVLGPVALGPPRAEATFPVFDISNFTQNLRTAVAQLRAIQQRVEMFQNQLDQYRWMLAQVEHLEDPEVREITGLLREIERLLEDTGGLVYTLPDTSERFLDTFPAFEASPDLREDELSRAETTLETLRAALGSTQTLGESFLPSQRKLSRMKLQALGTRGHLEIFQSQAVLTSYLAEEVTKLLQQQAVATNAEVVYYAHRLSNEVAAAETLREAIRTAHRGVGPYEATRPLPVVPPSLPRGFFAPRPGGRP